MSVSYDSYKIFYYVAHYQNITLAAKALFLTQPTVSHYILNLEKELNCKLFIRSKKGMQLSPEGELLFGHIAKAYSEISQGEEQLKEYLSMGKGIIKIGASETSMRNFLIQFLGRFKTKYPHIQLRICDTTSQFAEKLVSNGTIDFAVMTTPSPDSQLSLYHLADFTMTAIAGPGFSHLTAHPLSFQEAAEYPMICLESGTSGRYYLETLFATHGVHLQPDIELSSADLITPMTEQNLGIGFVPRIFAEHSLKMKRTVELTFEEKFPVRSICLLTDPNRQYSLACQKFIDELKLTQNIAYI